MPLPFLKRSNEASASAPIESERLKTVEGSESYDTIDAVVTDLIQGIHSKDQSMVKDALKSLIDCIQEADEKEDNSKYELKDK